MTNYYQNLSGRNFFTQKYIDKKHKSRLEYFKFNYPNQSLKVLDVGCAEGFFGKKLIEELGWDVDGVEISQDRLIATTNLNKVYSNIEDVKDKYDLILCFHVLEHLPNNDILDIFHHLLNDTGHLILEIPNKSGHRYIKHDNNPEHIQYFDQTSIINLLSQHQFTIKQYQIGCFESPAYNDSIRIQSVKTSNYYRYGDYVKLFNNVQKHDVIIYGTGGDYINYIKPIINNFTILGYYDDNNIETNLTIDDLKKYNNKAVILISSIKYEQKIIESLKNINWNLNNVFTLGNILDI